jgi:hypothetical protein
VQAPQYDQLQIRDPQRYFVHSEDPTAEPKADPGIKAEPAAAEPHASIHHEDGNDAPDEAASPLAAAQSVVDAYARLIEGGLGGGAAGRGGGALAAMDGGRAADAARDVVASAQEEGPLDARDQRRNPVAGARQLRYMDLATCLIGLHVRRLHRRSNGCAEG